MAPSVVPGDPGEYQVIATQWGIGHPPGYGFYALLGNVFTRLVFWGSPAWRVNLLSAVCGAAMVSLGYGIGRMLSSRDRPVASLAAQAPPVLGAAVLASGLDLWQHAVHANAHIVTALLATGSVFCLLRWWYTGRDRWLYAFCLIAGLSPVQHPLLVFAFPAYGLFVLVVRPRILRDWRTLGTMLGLAVLGLCAYLYYPIRCALGPPPAPGPTDMHTWAGFVRVVTAKGLRVNLGGFSIWDVLLRLWDVRVPLGLQYTWPTLLLAVVGLVVLWVRRWQPALLLTGYAACIIFVTVNVLQDAMAYLLGPVVVVGVLAGVGLAAALSVVRRWRGVPLALVVLAAILPTWSAVVNGQRMDLSHFCAADDWLAQMDERFGGQEQGAVVLAEWERMTPIYYYAALDGRYRRLTEPGSSEREMWAADRRDLRFVPVSAVSPTPFLDAAAAFVSLGPTYLTSYRPYVAATYRLLPSGDLWQVLPAWPRELPASANPISVSGQDRFEIVGWRLDEDRALPGQVLLLDLYMRLPQAQTPDQPQFYLPWAQLGETRYRFTMNERFATPWWQPGEIVVERFELPVPWHALPGSYPLQVGIDWLNQGRVLDLDDGAILAKLTDVEVLPADWRPSLERLESALGNLRGEILLRKARVNGRRVSEPGESIVLRPGQTLRVLLEWESLVPIEENYKVFVQLLDMSLQIRAQGDDKAPLRGSAPTLLWFPRWRRGMRFADTYELHVSSDLPPGHYPLVVGMYGFSTFKRAQTVSPNGDMAGDWITVAHLEVR